MTGSPPIEIFLFFLWGTVRNSTLDLEENRKETKHFHPIQNFIKITPPPNMCFASSTLLLVLTLLVLVPMIIFHSFQCHQLQRTQNIDNIFHLSGNWFEAVYNIIVTDQLLHQRDVLKDNWRELSISWSKLL